MEQCFYDNKSPCLICRHIFLHNSEDLNIFSSKFLIGANFSGLYCQTAINISEIGLLRILELLIEITHHLNSPSEVYQLNFGISAQLYSTQKSI